MTEVENKCLLSSSGPGPRSGPKGPRTKDQRPGPGLTLKLIRLVYTWACGCALRHEDNSEWNRRRQHRWHWGGRCCRGPGAWCWCRSSACSLSTPRLSSRTSSRDSGGQDGGPSSRGAGITPLSIFDKPEIWSQSNASLTFKSADL